jgi:hypothetical protein
MSLPNPCTRHARTIWMARCPDCTTWHLSVAIARRNGQGSVGNPGFGPNSHVRDAPATAAALAGASVPSAL